MRQTELKIGKRYAIELPGSVAQAEFMGFTTHKGEKRLKFFIPSLNIIHLVATAYCALDEWDAYMESTKESHPGKQGLREGKFEVQQSEMKALISFFKTIDVDAGLMSILITEGDSTTVEPALYIKHRDIGKIAQLLKAMSVYDVSNDILENHDERTG